MTYPNDDRLINLCQRHNKKAIDILIVRYSGFIRAWAREYLSRNAQLDFEELCLAGEGSFLIAIKTYDYKRGNFYKYVQKIIYNSFNSYFRIRTKENKNIDYYFAEENSPFAGYSLMEDDNDLLYENFEKFLEAHQNLSYLSKDMKTVLDLKRQGKTYKEIANIMGINFKRVDFLYQKSVKKIREYESIKNK